MSFTKIAPAFVKAQSTFKKAYKEAINPHFRSKYAKVENVIDAIQDSLSANNLGFIQLLSSDEGRYFIQTKLFHESGEFIESDKLEIIVQDKTNPQKLGSSITYFRRYSLMAFFGIPDTDDDDGNLASEPVKQPYVQQKPVQKETPKNFAPKSIEEAEYRSFQFPSNMIPQEFANKKFHECDLMLLKKFFKEKSEIYTADKSSSPQKESFLKVKALFDAYITDYEKQNDEKK